MTQAGETDGFKASDHVRTLMSHSHPRIIDYCIVNTGEIPQQILARYKLESAYPVINDRKDIETMGYRAIEDDIASIEGNVVRHDPAKLAKIIFGFLEEI
jgi:uncharacterized cofD-like protein